MFKRLTVSSIIVACFAINSFSAGWQKLDPTTNIQMTEIACVKALPGGTTYCVNFLFGLGKDQNIYRAVDAEGYQSNWVKMTLPSVAHIKRIAAINSGEVMVACTTTNGTTGVVKYWNSINNYWQDVLSGTCGDLSANGSWSVVSLSDKTMKWGVSPFFSDPEQSKTRGPISLTEAGMFWMVANTNGCVYYKPLGSITQGYLSTYNTLRDGFGNTLTDPPQITDLAAGYMGQFIVNGSTGKVHMYWTGTVGKKGWWDVSKDGNGMDMRATRVETNKMNGTGQYIAYIIAMDGLVYKRTITPPYFAEY